MGDCIVGDIPEPRGGDFDPATVTAGEEISSPFGPCTGERGGEVVLVGTARGSVDDRLRVASELSDDCARTARAVAGITAPELASRESGIRWTLSPNARYRWVVPDPRARAGGQTWLACVATSASALRYSGTVADAFSGGRLPDAFGSCWAGDVDQRRPHGRPVLRAAPRGARRHRPAGAGRHHDGDHPRVVRRPHRPRDEPD